MTEFTPEAVQLTHLIISYAELFTRLYGGKEGWLRQAGEPLNNMFLSDEELQTLLGQGFQPMERARAVLFWAGVTVPTEKVRFSKDKNGISRRHTTVMNKEALAWHVLAVQTLYHHPEYW